MLKTLPDKEQATTAAGNRSNAPAPESINNQAWICLVVLELERMRFATQILRAKRILKRVVCSTSLGQSDGDSVVVTTMEEGSKDEAK